MTVSTKERLEGLKEKVKDFPLEPGIYIMKNAQEKIIYIGKAKEIRKRVRSYFAQNVDSPKTCLLYTSPSPRDRTRSRMPSSA